MSENEKRLRRWIEALVPSGKSKGFELLDTLLSEHAEALKLAHQERDEALAAMKRATSNWDGYDALQVHAAMDEAEARALAAEESREAVRAKVLEEAKAAVTALLEREQTHGYAKRAEGMRDALWALKDLATAAPPKSEREMVPLAKVREVLVSKGSSRYGESPEQDATTQARNETLEDVADALGISFDEPATDAAKVLREQGWVKCTKHPRCVAQNGHQGECEP